MPGLHILLYLTLRHPFMPHVHWICMWQAAISHVQWVQLLLANGFTGPDYQLWCGQPLWQYERTSAQTLLFPQECKVGWSRRQVSPQFIQTCLCPPLDFNCCPLNNRLVRQILMRACPPLSGFTCNVKDVAMCCINLRQRLGISKIKLGWNILKVRLL